MAVGCELEQCLNPRNDRFTMAASQQDARVTAFESSCEMQDVVLFFSR
jgi:hypothetical protein